MQCKKHDWLFVKNISRSTEGSKEMKRESERYFKITEDSKKTPWWKPKENGTFSGIIANSMAIMLLEDGKKYVCGTCSEVLEVF